jgi:hypothetical protein
MKNMFPFSGPTTRRPLEGFTTVPAQWASNIDTILAIFCKYFGRKKWTKNWRVWLMIRIAFCNFFSTKKVDKNLAILTPDSYECIANFSPEQHFFSRKWNLVEIA